MKIGSSKRVFATALEMHYAKLLCEAKTHAFILRLTEMGLKSVSKIKSQHAACAVTLEQSNLSNCVPLGLHIHPNWLFFSG